MILIRQMQSQQSSDLVKFINTNTDGESSKEYLESLLKRLITLTDVLGDYRRKRAGNAGR